RLRGGGAWVRRSLHGRRQGLRTQSYVGPEFESKARSVGASTGRYVHGVSETSVRSIPDRIAAIDWSLVCAALEARGAAVAQGLLTGSECEAASQLYGCDERFRSRVVMARH